MSIFDIGSKLAIVSLYRPMPVCLASKSWLRPPAFFHWTRIYIHIIHSRLKDTGKRHGGLSVYIRNSIRTGIKFLNHNTNDCIWFKLCKDFFNNTHDICLCFSYAPHSTYSKMIDYDILQLVEKDITKYLHQGQIIIAGEQPMKMIT